MVRAPSDWAKSQLGHAFAAPGLLVEALSHPSLEGGLSYQRLEFLGDRVLGLVVAEWLFEQFPHEPEGVLARRFTGLVRREALADVARRIELAPEIIMAAGAREEGAAGQDNVLADVAEALIGALYKDGGLEVARAFIRRWWQPLIAAAPGRLKDAKSRLQEWAQGRGLATPSYREIGRAGPDHKPHFIIEAMVAGHGAWRGEGAAKREAEQAAAAAALAAIEGTKS